MVLVFLRDWRSAIVVVLNIPLALLAAVVALWLTGQTINLMTLGGLALAIGILVDEATVEIENIHTQLEQRADCPGRPAGNAADRRAAAAGDALHPGGVHLRRSSCKGRPRALFVPLSLAVGFAMVASYLLSSSLVPVVSVWLLRHVHLQEDHFFDRICARATNACSRGSSVSACAFAAYLGLAERPLGTRARRLAREIFPTIDSGPVPTSHSRPGRNRH